MDIHETRYARAEDGAYIAYQAAGDGTVDLACLLDVFGNLDVLWQGPAFGPLFRGLAESTRLILHDRRATGRHHAVVRDALMRWRGIENDTAGDGFYATLDGPARAIRCAQEVSDAVRSFGIEIRAGIHAGECEVIDGKLGGLIVSIGARVAGDAGPSEVLVSQTVKDLVAGSGLVFEDAGEHELKGVPDRCRLLRVAS